MAENTQERQRILQQELIDLAKSYGFAKVGFISGECFPEKWPSVIVLGYPTRDEALDYYIKLQGCVDGETKWIYEILEAKEARLANYLTKKGYQAEHLIFTGTWERIDLKRAAVMAGFGSIGDNNLLVTPELGPRIRVGAVFTDAIFDYDTPIGEVCTHCGMCRAACPFGGLGEQGYTRANCLAEFAPSPELAALQDEFEKRPTDDSRLQCRICMDACPIGE